MRRAVREIISGLMIGAAIIGFLAVSMIAYNRDFHVRAEEEAVEHIDLLALMMEMEEEDGDDMGYAVYEDVPVEFEYQVAVNSIANNYGVPISLVWAIAEKESNFDDYAVGDDGDSIGMFQVNTKWQTERMEELGVEKADLIDTENCALVAIDYMAELFQIKGSWAFVAMAYNEGAESALAKWRKGTYRTVYSLEVLEYMSNFKR